MPYRGNAPATTDLIAGRIELLSSSIGGLRAGLDAGKIRLLLTATKERLPICLTCRPRRRPDFPGYLMSVWAGVVAPAGTPRAVAERIHALVAGMLKDASAKKRMADAGLDVLPMSQDEFAAFVKAEYARWENIVRAAGVEPQ